MREFDQAAAKQFLAQLSERLKPQRYQAQLSALLSSASLVLSMALLAWWVANCVTAQQLEWRTLPWVLAAFVLRCLATAFAHSKAQTLAEYAQHQVRQQLLEHWGEPDSRHVSVSAERANLLVEPVEQLYGYYARFLPQLTTAVVTPVLIMAVVFYHDWIAALLLLIAAPIIPVFMALVGIGAARLNDRHIQTTQRLAGLFVDRVRHLLNLKLFAAERMAVNDISHAAEQMRSANMATLRVAFLSSAVLEFFASVAIAAVAIYVGFALLGYFTFGPAAQLTYLAGFTVLVLAPDFFQPLRNLSAYYHDRAAALAAAALLRDELWPIDAANDAANDAEALVEARVESVQVTPSDTQLVIHQLRFAYHQLVINNLSLQLKGGEVCLLDGPSGSGKSTLLKLLAGQLTTYQGELQRPSDTHIAYMAQEPYLQAGTLAENLHLVAPQASKQQMQIALQKAQLCKPLSYRIYERGQGLSGGEQRRLALARMFLRPAKLMLFDEPTAGLDATTAELVVQAIGQLQHPERILVIASHDSRLKQLANRHLGALK